MTVWRKRPEVSGRPLADEYRSGISLRALAAQTGLSYGSIHRRLSEAGVTMRPRGGRRPADTRVAR